jgi:hypothetical protein
MASSRAAAGTGAAEQEHVRQGREGDAAGDACANVCRRFSVLKVSIPARRQSWSMCGRAGACAAELDVRHVLAADVRHGQALRQGLAMLGG